MIVDKVIWASSVEYSDFWNINSLIHKKFLGLDCVLLLYGKKDNLNLNEDYGEIVECEFDEAAPPMPQLIWNKWHYTQTEPNTTWLVGDIDQIPLQREHFIDNIKDVPSDSYVHLAEDAFTVEWKNVRERLAGYYHVAKGDTFKKALDLDKKSLVEHVNTMIKSSQGEGKAHAERGSPIWAYEEWYTADLIKQNGFLDKFRGFGRSPKEKICGSTNCAHDENLFNKKHYIDMHCPRPYPKHKETINSILNKAWGELY